DVYAVTNDRPLRDRLLDAGVDVIGLRGRNTLEITET
ncbi:twitching motility protein PilT, partial [Halolamina salina]